MSDKNSSTNKDNKNNDVKEEEIDTNTSKQKKQKKELSDEDKEYKKNIDSMVEGLFLDDYDLRMNSYNLLKKEITTSTSSMTSIPKPLKFLKEHYEEIKNKYNLLNPTTEKEIEYKKLISDLISILCMVMLDIKETSLDYVLTGTKKNITEWGQEYIRALCGDIAKEYNNRLDEGTSVDDLYELVKIIIPFLIKEHCENDVIDLLIEVEKLNDMLEFVNENNYKKICLYLLSIVKYSADTEEFRETLELVYTIYFTKFKEYVLALIVALKIGNNLYIQQTFNQCKDPVIKKQLAFILARENIFIESDDLTDEIRDIMSNLKISEYYRRLGKELEVLEPKHPEDEFKTHLENKKNEDSDKLQSYVINMAYSIASAFINAGFGTEVLLSKPENNWLNKNKDEGLISLIGGLGLVNIWDSLEGPGHLYDCIGNGEKDPMKRAGRNIGLGISLTGIHDDNNTAVAILLEELADKNLNVKISSLFGLGIAAAGSQNDELMQPILDVFQDFSYGFELSAFCSLCYGLIYIGSANEDVFNEIFSILMSRTDGNKKIFESPFFVIYALGIGLLCLSKQKDTDLMIETLTTLDMFPKEMKDYLKILLTAFAYAGTGNVSKVQELMHIIAKPKEEVNPKVQSIAVIGCSLIAIGEDVGSEMLIRSFGHFLQFGDIHIKKTVSLAISLLNLSNPKVTIIDNLTKFCYDQNKEVAMNAIFSLGLVSSGTNHSRVGGLLRNLAAYYSEETNPLFMIRISQGLLHMGKGLLTLNPIYSHNQLLNNVGMAGVLVAIFSFTEIEGLILSKYQYLLYALSLAMKPRMVMTVDENLEPKPVQLMIGQAVDIVGQTGNPRTISGFQIHNSPAILAGGERCELNGDDYISYTDILENIVIVKENPDKRKK